MKKKTEVKKEEKTEKKRILFSRIPMEMAFELDRISKETGASKNFLIQEALRHFLGS